MKTLYSARSFVLSLVLLLVISITGTAVVPAGQAFAAAEASAATGTASVTETVYDEADNSAAGEAGAAVSAAADTGGEITVLQATYATAEYILSGGVTSEWQAIGLAQAGYRVPESYVQLLTQKVQAAGGSFPNVTDYARIVLAVKAVGGDPADFAGSSPQPGFNLLEQIYNSDKITGQTLNAPVYALLALDSGSYTLPGDAKWNQTSLLSEILSKQNSDGGFALFPGASDPDMTAIVLTALAAHKDDPAAAAAGQRAVDWLASKQDSNGGYGDSSESAAQAIIGLSSYGVDPAGPAFTKNEQELVGRLLSFRLASGAFAHNQGGSTNALATEQALQALQAYNLFSGGTNGRLYDFSNPAAQNPLVYVPLTIEGPEHTLAEGGAYAGNVLEALDKVAAANGLQITNPSGNYVTGIGTIAAGMYGGYDGWMYAVSRGGEWASADVGMKDFQLKASDRLLLYYAGGDTQLVDRVAVSKAQPRAGDAFTVTVTQKTWVWDNDTSASNPVTSSAAGVQVTIGDHTATTDANGKAEFAAGIAAGDYSLTITGYTAGQAPKVAKYTQALKVAPRDVTTTLSVEGPQGPVTEGTLEAADTLDALRKLTEAGNIPLEITESSFGSYVSGIAGIQNGTNNGYWSFVVERRGEWIYPSVGMGEYELQSADRVLVYFAGSDTRVVNSVQLSPAQPKPGQTFSVKVTQKHWVWNDDTFSNDPVTTPAAAVEVAIGGTTVTTDEQGVAVFENGLPGKIYTLAVTGYVADSTPKVARYTQSLKIVPGNVTAALSIEGPQGPVASGTLDAYNAYDALLQLADGNIPLQITEYSFGPYVWGINGIQNGMYGGSDYWAFAVSRAGEWIYPEVGLNDFVLQPSDRVLVYYSGDNTHVVNSASVTPAQPKPGEAFSVTVTQKHWVWNDATFTSDPVISPAAGVQVTVGGTTATTDAGGKAVFEKGLLANTYTLAVTGYVADYTPKLVRHTQSLTVADTPGVPEPASATISVIGDSSKGTILAGTTVILNDGETAYSLLIRQLGGRVIATTSGGSPYVVSIDGLKEFDRGPKSGWMYYVNGKDPGVSAGDYRLSNGDVLAWFYTADYEAVSPAAGGGSGSAGTVDITTENTLPLNQVGQTTAVMNLNTRMTAPEAAELSRKLAANTAAFEQEVTPGADASLKDSGGEVQLLIPAGAVSGTVKISMKETSSSRNELVSGLYTFSPDGTKFLKPVDLSITVPVTGNNPANLALAWLDPATGRWIPVPAVLDAKTGVLTGKASHFTDYAVVDRSRWEPQQEQLKSDIAATAKEITAAEELSDWQAIGLARSGHSVPASYLEGVKEQLADSQGQLRKVTDYERLVLGVAAAGADPQAFGGYNLIERIYNNDKMTSQGSNGLIFALIALGSGSYTVPADAEWTLERLLQALLDVQDKDGGFPLTAGGTADPDITAMAVTALSAHTGEPAVAEARDKAIAWLSQQQQEDGGYKQAGEENSESTAQVIIALSTAGIGPGDSRFVKASGGLLSHLASFRQADGGYAHLPGQPANSVATEQALLALTAYQRYLTGDAKLFGISSSAGSGGTVFTDESLISAWALESVRLAYEKKLMEGISADSLIFAPKQKITRAEFAALLLRLTHNEPAAAGAAPVFSDVKTGAWYYGVVLKAKELGIVGGITDTTFNPNGVISRQDMAVMIFRAFKLENAAASAAVPQAVKFADEGLISSYASSAVRAVTELGYMTGSGGTFDPAAAVTREMAAVVAVRLP